ncbi:MAG: hypothetical protein RMI91_11220 [Gemmatales bacterium]|nr:hypothetical protein [Gemmatales bacterium]
MSVTLAFLIDREEASSWSYDFEAALVWSLLEGKRKAYGFLSSHDDDEVMSLLDKTGERYRRGSYFIFTITSPKTLEGILGSVYWTNLLPVVIDSNKKLEDLEKPRTRYRWWLVPDERLWFQENLHNWDILCFLGTSCPLCQGVSILSQRLSFHELHALVMPVLTKSKFVIEAATFWMEDPRG